MAEESELCCPQLSFAVGVHCQFMQASALITGMLSFAFSYKKTLGQGLL